MAKYLALRIYNSYLEYDKVIKKYPKYKKEIDAYLAEWKENR